MKNLDAKRKILLIVFVLLVVATPLYQYQVHNAEALFHDTAFLAAIAANTAITAGATTGSTLKETIGDAIAWAIADFAIEEMTRQTVNWISGTSDGSPKFVTNVEGFLGNVADKAIGEFLLNEVPLVCGAFRHQIRARLVESFRKEREFQCTLTDVIENVGDYNEFIRGDFFRGGWSGWLSISRPANSSRGATLAAQNSLEARIVGKQNIELAKVEWGNGFIAWEQCPDDAKEVCPPEPGSSEVRSPDSCTISERICTKEVNVNGKTTQQKVDKETRTPGSVIQGQIDKAIGTGQDRLIVADEINEIIGALLTRLVSEVLSPDGLLKVEPDNITGGRPDTDLCEDYGICQDDSGSGGSSDDEVDSGNQSNLIFLKASRNGFVPNSGNPVVISWTSDRTIQRAKNSGDLTLTLQGGRFGQGREVAAIGSANDTISQDTTYTLTANGTISRNSPGISGGSQQVNESVTITVPFSDEGIGPPPTTGTGNDGTPTESIKADLSNVTFVHDAQVESWGETANLQNVSVGGGDIVLDQEDGTGVHNLGWPEISNNVVGTAWIFVWRNDSNGNGRWVASTWDYLRRNQERKSTNNLLGPSATLGELSDFAAVSGEQYGFMVSCVARAGLRNCQERSNVVMATWP